MRDHVGGPLPYFFKAIDVNGDGLISVTEYENFFRCMGIDSSYAGTSFPALDTDGDGTLSSQEFVAAGEEFFVGEDENASTQTYWGPLVD